MPQSAEAPSTIVVSVNLKSWGIGDMAQCHYFQRNAESCMARAQAATDEAERASWLASAQRWLRLANEASSKARDEPLTPQPVERVQSLDAADQSNQQVTSADATLARAADN
jgi:hypothetical protein